jgi:soluble lytic murein transglycosylase-like protein
MFTKAILIFTGVVAVLIILGAGIRCAQAAPECSMWDAGRVEARAGIAGPYLTEVTDALSELGLPHRWAYLMLEESGGNPGAKSAAGALGPWQLTAATARRYGCSDRTDPREATLAAGRYILHLLEAFNGDEAAVVMAYNMGGTNLRKNGPTREARALAAQVICAFYNDPLYLNGYK